MPPARQPATLRRDRRSRGEEGRRREEAAARRQEGRRREGRDAKSRREEGRAAKKPRPRRPRRRSPRRQEGRPPKPESHAALVRRARRINRELAEVYPYAHPELDFDEPLPAAGRHGPVRPDHRPAGQPDDPRALRRLPDPRGHGRGRPGGAGGADPADRLLPGQDEVAASACPPRCATASAARCPGRLEDLVTLPGVGRKTANRRARQRLRRPGHHRGHPLRPARAPLAVDRRRRTRRRSRRRSPRSSPRASGRCSRTA